MHQIKVRPATKRDAATCSSLRCFYNEQFATDVTIDEVDSARKDQSLVVAVLRGAVVGFAWAKWTPDEVMEARAMWTKAPLVASELGPHLLGTALITLRGKYGLPRKVIANALSSNFPAIAVLERSLGFHATAHFYDADRKQFVTEFEMGDPSLSFSSIAQGIRALDTRGYLMGLGGAILGVTMAHPITCQPVWLQMTEALVNDEPQSELVN